ncbi:DUF2231 domain-containing protein [Microbispora bryophytorum]|uniref:DUF2231 domain-containing protein n=1 Tax=Microbispora bryophytorum TaxID=1460882 RepID=UPI0033D1CB6C
MAQRALDRLVNAIEGEDRLDRPGHRLEQGLAFAENLLGITRGRARGFLHGVWLGHPLHPVLTDLPIGSWTTALVLDLTGQKCAARAAVGVGLAGALAAAVTGLHDWQHTHDNARRVGMVHGTLNTLAVALYGWSWWQRGRGHHLRGRLATLLGYPVIMAGGFLGGTLVHRHRIGVDQTSGQLEPRRFTPVLAERDLTGNRPHRVRAATWTSSWSARTAASTPWRMPVRTWAARCPRAGSATAPSPAPGTVRSSSCAAVRV